MRLNEGGSSITKEIVICTKSEKIAGKSVFKIWTDLDNRNYLREMYRLVSNKKNFGLVQKYLPNSRFTGEYDVT
jgi:hypothetical protein